MTQLMTHLGGHQRGHQGGNQGGHQGGHQRDVVLETGSRDWISRSDLERWLTVRASSSGIITGAYHSEIGTFTVIQPVGIALGDQSWQWYILGLGDRRQGLWSQPADFGVFARLRARRTRDGEVVHREFTVGTQSRL